MKLLEAIPLLLDGTLSKVKLGYIDYKIKDGYLVAQRDGRALGSQAIPESYFDKDVEPVYSVPKVKVGDSVTIASSNPCYHGKSGRVTGVYQAPGNNEDVLATVDSQGSKLFEAKNLRVERVETKVISAFPGTGKTTFANKIPNTLDLDSSEFKKAHGEYNFLDKYKKAIKDAIGVYDYIIVSTHQEVRELLATEGIPFTLVYPAKGLKSQYMKRYAERGDNEEFMTIMRNSFMCFSENLDKEPHCEKRIVLREKDSTLLSIKNLLDEEMI